MKLRNKKTGEIIDLDEWTVYTDAGCFSVENDCDETAKSYRYRTLAELNEEWEDYKPKEPLIKDEKIRKAVRAWAEANGREKLLAIKLAGRLEVSDGSPHLIYISFHADKETLNSLDDRTYYTIAELCGEEEE